MATYDELRAAADQAWKAVEAPQRPLFIVSINTSSIASGARETLAKLQELSQRDGFDVMGQLAGSHPYAVGVIAISGVYGPDHARDFFRLGTDRVMPMDFTKRVTSSEAWGSLGDTTAAAGTARARTC